MDKDLKKNFKKIYMFIYTYESICCTLETNATL